MINENTKSLARKGLYARARALKNMRYGKPVQRTFTIRDIRSGTPKKELLPWLNLSLVEQITAPALYTLTVNEIDVATALREAFVTARATQSRLYSMPRDNALHPIGTTIYVGRSNGICRRLKQHLWQAPLKTYALNMYRWCPDIDGSVTVAVQPILGQPVDETVQDIEDTMWKNLLPIFGKSGNR